MDFYKVEYEQRADQVALKLFGDVKYTKELIRVNPILQKELIVSAGTILKIPKINTFANTKEQGINLWS